MSGQMDLATFKALAEQQNLAARAAVESDIFRSALGEQVVDDMLAIADRQFAQIQAIVTEPGTETNDEVADPAV